jgi:predicted transcriptional regulator
LPALAVLTEATATFTLIAMEVHFTPEQEAQLGRIAGYSGTDPAKLVKDAALRVVEEDMQFRASVHRGIEQADRGELINHDDVKAQIERLLQP